jgi:hypothetical protein
MNMKHEDENMFFMSMVWYEQAMNYGNKRAQTRT